MAVEGARMTAQLFTPMQAPRRPRRVMMHVADAGNGAGCKVIQFRCNKCGHDTGWLVDERTISENRRGLPCPICNAGVAT